MSASRVDALLAALRSRSGFAADAVDRGRLSATLAARARASGRGADAEAEAARALDDETEYAAIEAVFAPPETWLFRYPASYEAVRRRFAGRTAPVRALIAGCGGFAEPASLAAALLSTVGASCVVRIEAFDRNPQLVRDGRTVFAGMLVRGGIPPWAEPFFERDGGGWTMSREVRAAVRERCASVEEIVGELSRAQARFDLVMFRNVAIYLDAARRRAAYAGLASLLAADGVLMVGHAESHTAAEATGLIPESDAGAFMLAAPRAAPLRPPPRDAPPRAPRREPQEATPRDVPRAGAPSPVTRPNGAEGVAVPPQPRSADEHAVDAEERLSRGDLDGAWTAATKALYLDRSHEAALVLASRIAEARGDAAGAARFRARALHAHLRAAEREDDRA
ncbi:MAG: CheR family methyltransferase [Phycisphaerales bacterium]